ncbi:MAG: phosphate ABC transporter substrate-binding protein [Peptococcaceae bacterium]|jgi:phosphate transport system substrate-binding protein|nr:phosphate ABC transporter substrate-binding protein [Peptococcaceae bacterium]MDH7523795.1 phosphate ABC transporter substrate-binding protein [Peptococcaceae bacterium]
MLKSQLMKIAAVAGILAIIITAAGCGGSEKPPKDETAQPAELSGTIQIAGSTSVQPLSEELAKAFMAKNPRVRINVAGGGSGAGIKAAVEGTADIGASSRELKPEERTVKEFTIALDGVAVIVHKNNKISELKKDEIKKIFTGEVTDWSLLGGEKGPIHVISREEGSGTRGAFDELVLGKDAKVTDKAVIQNSTGAVRTAVAADKAAIGYISLGSLNNEVKALKVDGAEATPASVKNGVYKISRPFIYLTQKEPAGLVKAYLDFVLSPEGQDIVRKNFIPVK